LTEEAKADMQTRLDGMHQEFVQAVATGRGQRASADIVQKRFGEGRMFGSSAAMGHGLVGKVQSAREFYRAIMPQQEEAPAFGLPKASIEVARKRV
jgi:ClpP class serine protease